MRHIALSRNRSTHRCCALLSGGCLCGTLRYRVTAALTDVAHCHCNMCRKSSGGIVTTWATVPINCFEWTQGVAAKYPSSTHTERFFCAGCGALLTLFTQRAPNTIDFTIATLDQPENVRADRHIWWQSRLSWLSIDPHLPHENQEQL